MKLKLIIATTQLFIDSVFDNHDSPKGEVNQNNLVDYDDVSGIIKHFVDGMIKETLCA